MAQSSGKVSWFSPWTLRALIWVLLAFVAMMALEYPFVFFFDTTLTNIGFMYVYFWALPQAALLYFVAFKLQVRWTSTAIVGLAGIIGAPIDYYFEWIVQQNLVSSIFAFAYIPLYIIAGLSADLSMILLHPERKPLRQAVTSSFIFTIVVLLATVFATFIFYPGPLTLEGTWLEFGYFLIPYALITGTMGGYVGFSVPSDTAREGVTYTA